MDWSKAKNILLVLFLTLNCILLYNNYISFSGGGSILSDEMSSNTLSVLTSRGVGLNCEIPPSAKAATIIYGPYFEDRQKIADVLLGPKSRDTIDDGEIIEGTKRLKFYNNYFDFEDVSPVEAIILTIWNRQGRCWKMFWVIWKFHIRILN